MPYPKKYYYILCFDVPAILARLIIRGGTMSEIIEPIQELAHANTSKSNLKMSGLLRIIKRNRNEVPYDEDKIKILS